MAPMQDLLQRLEADDPEPVESVKTSALAQWNLAGGIAPWQGFRSEALSITTRKRGVLAMGEWKIRKTCGWVQGVAFSARLLHVWNAT
jgi:hypothetical protein